ncbi:hypothetical protein [Mucilaginibacter lacusdianchii]|uniref:hypothetical protein n=1 Tax=Mucilaginibacter lacusdianchii TaxID=2684211 RepID=UPI00131E386C|nr:hypothetical protein [Mucilaginibacter sp. JXJ CY 39]
MSTKSAKPVQTKEEALFDKVKNAISDVWGSTTDAAEDLKENNTEKEPAVKQETAPASQNKLPRSKAATNAAKPKAKASSK